MQADTWAMAIKDERVIARYRRHVSPRPLASGCLPWMGALSAQGSGRFWVAENSVVVAHRFGFALAYGVDALLSYPHVAHQCDEASCQNPQHMRSASAAQNTREWLTRRDTIGNPLRDRRGALGRAVALRDAALAGDDLEAASRAGMPENDLYQDPLPLDGS